MLVLFGYHLSRISCHKAMKSVVSRSLNRSEAGFLTLGIDILDQIIPCLGVWGCYIIKIFTAFVLVPGMDSLTPWNFRVLGVSLLCY